MIKLTGDIGNVMIAKSGRVIMQDEGLLAIVNEALATAPNIYPPAPPDWVVMRKLVDLFELEVVEGAELPVLEDGDDVTYIY